jgi:hypothetical protein
MSALIGSVGYAGFRPANRIAAGRLAKVSLWPFEDFHVRQMLWSKADGEPATAAVAACEFIPLAATPS